MSRSATIFPMLGLAAFSVLVALPAASVLAQTAPPSAAKTSASLTVTGDGQVAAAPDMAVVSVGVTTTAHTAAEALSGNSAQVKGLLDLLSAQGVAAKDIQTQDLSLGPLYQDRQAADGRPLVSGYQATNMVTVRVHNLDGLGELLDRMVGSGANQLNGIRFDLSDRGPLEDQARTEAVKDAMRKAALLADAAGLTLGPVVSISDAGAVGNPVPMFAREAVAAVPVAGGEVSVSASVLMTFDLKQGG